MQASLIAGLLGPYVEGLSPHQLTQISTYLDLLVKWNARMNLTAVRDAENIVKRHFGESFFLARNIPTEAGDLTDVGSGAGFPAIPIHIYRPELRLTLVEAQQRKATFLREVGRAIHLDFQVKNLRAEELVKQQPRSASVVTFRAVEKFQSILPVAAELVSRSTGHGSGCLAILIGSSQGAQARALLPDWRFDPEIPVPEAENRVILRGEPR